MYRPVGDQYGVYYFPPTQMHMIPNWQSGAHAQARVQNHPIQQQSPQDQNLESRDLVFYDKYESHIEGRQFNARGANLSN